MMHEVEARALFVDRVHDPPPGLRNMGALEHHFLRLGVVLPTAPRLEIHWTQLPLLQRVVNAAEKTQVLLLVCNREPVFQQLDARANQHALELRHGAEELLVLLGRAEPHDSLDARTVVPTPVEEDDFAGCGEVRYIALEVPLRALAIIGCRQRHHATNPRIELLTDALDRAALPGRIASFEQDQDLLPRTDHPILQLHELRLESK